MFENNLIIFQNYNLKITPCIIGHNSKLIFIFHQEHLFTLLLLITSLSNVHFPIMAYLA